MRKEKEQMPAPDRAQGASFSRGACTACFFSSLRLTPTSGTDTMRQHTRWITVVLIALIAAPALAAGDVMKDAAPHLKALQTYDYGQSRAGLRALELLVARAAGQPKARRAMADRRGPYARDASAGSRQPGRTRRRADPPFARERTARNREDNPASRSGRIDRG